MSDNRKDTDGLNAPDLPSLADNRWPVLEKGWVWLVGGGPGDPGLLTLHALNALKQAEVIIYDALVDEHILQWANPGAIIEYAGKRGGKPSPLQRDISMRLIELARQGKRVLRLKGGDPFVFGRGGEEAQTLVQAGIPIRIIPGISAGIGGLAYAGIPVTHRDVNQAVTFLSGHDRTGLAPSAINWQGIADGSQVIVMYMAMKHLPEISEKLIAAGRDPHEPVAIVCNATQKDMRVLETTLQGAATDAAAAGMKPPSIICVGKVTLMRQCLDWMAQAQGHEPRNLDPLGMRAQADSA
ncbi:MAG: uroporphyrinogen-III C-methyltransferase [Candidatus Puniceispirillaceae bacterium]